MWPFLCLYIIDITIMCIQRQCRWSHMGVGDLVQSSGLKHVSMLGNWRDSILRLEHLVNMRLTGVRFKQLPFVQDLSKWRHAEYPCVICRKVISLQRTVTDKWEWYNREEWFCMDCRKHGDFVSWHPPSSRSSRPQCSRQLCQDNHQYHVQIMDYGKSEGFD